MEARVKHAADVALKACKAIKPTDRPSFAALALLFESLQHEERKRESKRAAEPDQVARLLSINRELCKALGLLSTTYTACDEVFQWFQSCLRSEGTSDVLAK